MNKHLSNFVVALFFTASLHAQEVTIKENHLYYKCTVTDMQAAKYRGYLHTISDSMLHIARSKIRLTFESPDTTRNQQFSYMNISKVSYYHRGNAGVGLVLGALVGLVAGELLVSSTYKNQDFYGEAQVGAGFVGLLIELEAP